MEGHEFSICLQTSRLCSPGLSAPFTWRPWTPLLQEGWEGADFEHPPVAREVPGVARVINLHHVASGEIGARSVVDSHPGLTPEGGRRGQLLFLYLGGFWGQTAVETGPSWKLRFTLCPLLPPNLQD